MPKISIVMSVFNNEADVGEAIESMLNQSFSEFELIIINDASTDNSAAIIEKFSQSDDRIIVLHNEENLKLAASLNRGIQLARGAFIARMDADDVSLPNRLKTQFEYMQTHADVAVCGAWVELYEDSRVVWKTNVTAEKANCAAFFESCFHHPTVMIRKTVLDQLGGYDESVQFAQDCHLWSRLAFDHQQVLHNIPQVLLRYRSHPEKSRDQYRLDQYDKATELRQKNLRRLNMGATDEAYQWHDILCCAKTLSSKEQFQSLLTWIDQLESANRSVGLLSVGAFAEELNRKLLGVCLASAEVTIYAILAYLQRCKGRDFLKNGYRCSRMLFWYLKALLSRLFSEVVK